MTTHDDRQASANAGADPATARRVRVRFAPSPTGALHIGGARTAYYNWLFARQQGGKFVLRIDDTDRARSTEASYRQILDSLRWLGITWDEGPDVEGEYGPYRQSQRQSLYEAELQRMLTADLVYPCFCSPEELAAEREQAQQAGRTPRYSGRCRRLSPAERVSRLERGDAHTFRLRAPQSGDVVVTDLIRGQITFAAAEVDDFIVWKADGTPTYHFASCIDDGRMQISHIIRAEEHLSNTPRHIVLFEALGYEVPVFAHVPMILAPDRSKLSKRHGATSVEEYRNLGILPEALVNYLLLLGFSPGEEREVLTRDEALSVFDLTHVSKNAAVYDLKKLEWLNGHYIRQASADTLTALVWTDLTARGWAGEDESRERLAWIRGTVGSVQSRSRDLRDMVEQLAIYYESPAEYDAKGVRKHFSQTGVAEHLTMLARRLDDVRPFDAGGLERVYRTAAAEWEVRASALIHPTRLALTGRTAGPGLFELMTLLGRSVCQQRMRQAAAAIQSGGLT